MKHILFFGVSALLAVSMGKAQNVSINNTGFPPDVSAQLDVQANNKGMLIPRLALAATNSVSPVSNPAVSLLVFNTANAGSGNTAVSVGFYFWTGSQWQRLTQDAAWLNGGNTLSSNGSFGTLSNNSIDLVSNSQVRGRISNSGEFHWGAVTTAIPGDLMSATSNAAFPFALSGYSSFDGAGVYGAVETGNTQFAAVQGEYRASTSSLFNTAGVRGSNQSTVAGTGFRAQSTTGPRVGVIGNTTASTGQYTFGVHGTIGSTTTRCGALFGDDFGIALGSVAYYAANLNDYSFYGFGRAFETGLISGRSSGQRLLSESNTHIGLGIYGGVMGGWMRGLVYGTHVKGERYSLYVDGAGVTNQPMAELADDGNGSRQAWYGTASTQAMVQTQGKMHLNGEVGELLFDASFQRMIGNQSEQLVVTLTPVGAPAQLYLESITSKGFRVKRADGQTTPIQVNWMAVAPRAQQPTTLSSEILAKDFDQRMDRVMFNDNNTSDQPGHLWWDGSRVRFDRPPAKQPNPDAGVGVRSSTH
jgi:hypothetical protein